MFLPSGERNESGTPVSLLPGAKRRDNVDSVSLLAASMNPRAVASCGWLFTRLFHVPGLGACQALPCLALAH